MAQSFRLHTNYIRQTQEVELIATNQAGQLIIVGILMPTETGFKLISRHLQAGAIEGPAPTGLMAWNYQIEAHNP